MNHNKYNNDNNNQNKNGEICNSYISKNVKIKEIIENENTNKVDLEDNDKYSYYNNLETEFDNAKDEIVINEDYIPNCMINFSFDLNSKCYLLEKGYNNSNIFKEILHKEAINKINEYQN